MPKEIETKFKIASINDFKESLKKIDAVFVSKELEKDVYYRGNTAHRSPGVIRLRSIGDKGIFTLKNASSFGGSRTYKVREEIEVAVDNAKTFDVILQQLGFKPFFKKEKIRETYTWKDTEIAVDTLPFIGTYVEIEATEKNIEEAAGLLNLDMSKAIPDSYIQLFNYYKMIHKDKNLNFLFDKTE